MAMRTALAMTLSTTMLLTQAGCNQVECGEGTTERNGECVAADGDRPVNDDCGAGTHYDDAEGGCVPDLPPTVCGPNTAEQTDPDTGYTVCVGTGVIGCGPLACPDPANGKVSLCGRLYDVETDVAVGTGADGTMCVGSSVGGTATGGPCDLEIKFYPALKFATAPTTTPALPPESFNMNNCGYFAAINIAEPELGFMGIGVDDRGTTVDDYVLAGVALPATAGLLRDDLIVYAVTRATDSTWSGGAGLSPGFNSRGAYVPIFLHGEGAPDSIDPVNPPAEPIAGVVVTENGANEPANTYYFLDEALRTRSMIGDSAGDGGPIATGMNGSAVKINSSLVNHSGTGNEPPPNCQWPVDLAAAIPGVTFVQRRIAEDPNGNTCP